MPERDESPKRIALGKLLARRPDATDLAQGKTAGVARVVAQIFHPGVERGPDALLIIPELLAFAMFPGDAGTDHGHVLRRLNFAIGNFRRAGLRLRGFDRRLEQIIGGCGDAVARRAPVTGPLCRREAYRATRKAAQKLLERDRLHVV